MSSQAYVSHSLCFVCRSASDFFGARIRYAIFAGSDARLPSRRTMEPMSVPVTVLCGPGAISSRGSLYSIVISPSTRTTYSSWGMYHHVLSSPSSRKHASTYGPLLPITTLKYDLCHVVHLSKIFVITQSQG